MPLFKKKSLSRHPQKRKLLRKCLFGVLMLLLASSVLGGFWLLSKLGPRDVDFDNVVLDVEVTDELLAFKRESLALESEFDEIISLRAPNSKDLELLRKARDRQEKYVSGLTGLDADATARLRELTVRYQNLAAAELLEKSLQLETEAGRLAATEDYVAARDKYQEAYRLQDEINQDYPKSSAKNSGRAAGLFRQVEKYTAEPLAVRSIALAAEADALIEKKDWERAEAKLTEAIALQDELNRRFRGTNQANMARLSELQLQLLAIQSGQIHVEIEKTEASADALQASGQNLEAAQRYLEAARLQRELNQDFRGSPFASSELVAEYMRKAETAQSFELGRSIEANSQLLRQYLSKRETFKAIQTIAELREEIKKMQEAFPRSSLNDVDLQMKIRYLNLIQDDLEFIQDRVYGALLPIPNDEEFLILKTEVPQALFSKIMGMNPSRNRGNLNPVDSVNWIEAKQFCERLSWIMGKSVRLPTENEFRACLGRLRYVVLEDHVWSLGNANGKTQPTGQKEPLGSGCYDLLGNVSEWLESVDSFDTEDAKHIGGHAQDQLEIIFTVPLRKAPREERNRMTGFRFVVKAK